MSLQAQKQLHVSYCSIERRRGRYVTKVCQEQHCTVSSTVRWIDVQWRAGGRDTEPLLLEK